jgi:hypothetical protein
MKNSQKSFIVPLVIIIAAVVAIGGGTYYYLKNKKPVNPPSITVLSPNGGEKYKSGDSLTIRWNVSGFGLSPVNLFLMRRDETQTRQIAKAIQNTGTYTWTIPENVIAGTYVVHVSVPDTAGEDNIDNPNRDESDKPFTINKTSASIVNNSNLKTYTNTTYHFSFQYPSEYKIYEGMEGNMYVVRQTNTQLNQDMEVDYYASETIANFVRGPWFHVANDTYTSTTINGNTAVKYDLIIPSYSRGESSTPLGYTRGIQVGIESKQGGFLNIVLSSSFKTKAEAQNADMSWADTVVSTVVLK